MSNWVADDCVKHETASSTQYIFQLLTSSFLMYQVNSEIRKWRKFVKRFNPPANWPGVLIRGAKWSKASRWTGGRQWQGSACEPREPRDPAPWSQCRGSPPRRGSWAGPPPCVWARPAPRQQSGWWRARGSAGYWWRAVGGLFPCKLY